MLKIYFQQCSSNLSFITNFTILFILFLSSCSTAPQPNPVYGKQLKNVHINSILKGSGGKLIFGTDNGVFIYTDKLFYKAGLQGHRIVDIVCVGKGKLIAAINHPGGELGKKTLFKTTNGSRSWHAYMGNYGGWKEYNRVFELAVHPEDKTILFATGGPVTRSLDGGETWKIVLGRAWDAIGIPNYFLKFDPNNPDIVWAGGDDASGGPSLFKSTNRGDSWHFIEYFSFQNFPSAASVNDIVFSPEHAKTLLAGLSSAFKPGRAILKSTDGGKNWHSVLQGILTYTFTHSTRASRIIYASGRNKEGTLFFAKTRDYGETWKMIEVEDRPFDFHVHDMASVMQNGREVLYFATNKGVYTYMFEE